MPSEQVLRGLVRRASWTGAPPRCSVLIRIKQQEEPLLGKDALMILKKNNNDKNPSAFRDRNLFDSVHFIPFSHSIS